MPGVPESNFDMIQDRLNDGYLNIICTVGGVFPRSELVILAGDSHITYVTMDVRDTKGLRSSARMEFACDWWYNVDSSQAIDHYKLNADPLKNPYVPKKKSEELQADPHGVYYRKFHD